MMTIPITQNGLKDPYEILPGTKAKYRNSIFLERAIIGERLRLGMGLPVRDSGRAYRGIIRTISKKVQLRKNTMMILSDQHRQVCLQCLPRKESSRNRCLSEGLSVTSMSGSMS